MQTRLEDLSFSYASYDESTPEKVLLSHIELTVGPDQAVLILGQPGQGKTTLASILSLITPRYNSGSLSGRVLYDGLKTKDLMGRCLCAGFFGWVASQAVFNIGMCLALLPVMGVTLPFFSGGGSSAMCLYFAYGLVQNVFRHHKDVSGLNLRRL